MAGGCGRLIGFTGCRPQATAMEKVVPERLVREMGLTHEEFLRTLPAALGHADYRVNGRDIRIRHAGGEVRIRLEATFHRRFGSLVIPATPVEFLFLHVDEAERSVFFERFDRCFQRGGG